MKSGFKLLLILFFFNISLLSSFAQDSNSEYRIKSLCVTVYSGISVPIRGGNYWNQYWEYEYLVGGNVFVHLNNQILAGIRLNFNHWLNDENALAKNYPLIVGQKISGDCNVIEIVPSLRIILSDEYNKSNLFLQFGGGYFYLEGNYPIAYIEYINNTNVISTYNQTFNFNKPGVNLGLGIKAGKVEIFPLYSIMFTPHEPTQFITLNLGYHF